MKLLKICIGEWKNASRDKRELSAYQETGANVLVMAKGVPSDKYTKDVVDGFDVLRFSTRPLGLKVPVIVNRVASVFTWARCARKIEADVISGHDLTALLIGYLSNIGRKRKAKLIYDSHEFELGRAVERSKFKIWYIKHMEGFLIKRCIFSIMVNDSIADEIQKIYRLKERPVVVRSTPNYWNLDKKKIDETRSEICGAMSIPEDTFLIMYHGGVMPERNVEALIDAISRNPKIAGVVLGNPSAESYLEKLKKRAEEKGVLHRIYFHNAVPIEELYRYVSAVDLGTLFVSAKYKSYYLSLPNKFFENIQSLTPVLTSEFPEMKRIIEHYSIGLTVDITQEEQIDNAIEQMRTNSVFYNECKKNLLRAKEELCWEREKKKLIDACQRGL